tara:strand:+ start:471 stop:761 length:291 start_codon:yes stop_codon:yes gene_type:complete
MSYDVEVGDLIQYRDRFWSDPDPTGTNADAWGEIGVVLQVTSWFKMLPPAGHEFTDVDEHPKDAVIYVNNKGDRTMAKIRDIIILKKGAKNEFKKK